MAEMTKIYNLKKEKISTKKYKVFFTEHAVFRTLAKLQGVIDWEDSLMDNFVYSTIYKDIVNYDSSFRNVQKDGYSF